MLGYTVRRGERRMGKGFVFRVSRLIFLRKFVRLFSLSVIGWQNAQWHGIIESIIRVRRGRAGVVWRVAQGWSVKWTRGGREGERGRREQKATGSAIIKILYYLQAKRYYYDRSTTVGSDFKKEITKWEKRNGEKEKKNRMRKREKYNDVDRVISNIYIYKSVHAHPWKIARCVCTSGNRDGTNELNMICT